MPPPMRTTAPPARKLPPPPNQHRLPLPGREIPHLPATPSPVNNRLLLRSAGLLPAGALPPDDPGLRSRCCFQKTENAKNISNAPLEFSTKNPYVMGGRAGGGWVPPNFENFLRTRNFPPGSVSRSTIGGARRPPTPTVRPLRRRRLCPILPAAVPRPPLAGNVW